MSTKSIRNALDSLVLTDARLKPVASLALAEVEAIERAAKALDGCGIRAAWEGDAWFARGEERETLGKAAETLASIAKDAP